MGSEVAIRQPVHEAVGQRVELLRSAGLRNASTTTAERAERGHIDDGGSGEGGARRRREIDVEFVEVQVVGSKIQHVIRRTGWRSGRTVEIRRQQASHRGSLLETDLGCGGAREHRVAVIGTSVGAHERDAARKHVERFVICVRPYAHLRIVVEVGVLERIAVISSRGVGSRRHRNALQIRCRRNRELAEDPTLREFVVKHDGVAVVVSLASTTEPGPQRIPRGRTGN